MSFLNVKLFTSFGCSACLLAIFSRNVGALPRCPNSPKFVAPTRGSGVCVEEVVPVADVWVDEFAPGDVCVEVEG